jgi:hypothetical protein
MNNSPTRPQPSRSSSDSNYFANKITESNAVSYTLGLIAITFVLRVLIAAFTGLGIGESYYFRGVLNLSMSYFDQPPLFFWLSGITTKLFGLSNLTLRLPAVFVFCG